MIAVLLAFSWLIASVIVVLIVGAVIEHGQRDLLADEREAEIRLYGERRNVDWTWTGRVDE